MNTEHLGNLRLLQAQLDAPLPKMLANRLRNLWATLHELPIR